jgi:hypothetical protein
MVTFYPAYPDVLPGWRTSILTFLPVDTDILPGGKMTFLQARIGNPDVSPGFPRLIKMTMLDVCHNRQ